MFSLIPIAVTLVSVPLYLEQIGLERYGILTLIWTLTGVFAFFDFGMGAATNYLVARAHSGLDSPETGSVILTTGAVNLSLGCLLGLIFWLVVGPLALGSVKSGFDIAVEIDAALPWIALLLPVSFTVSILRNALEGQRRFFTANTIGTGGQAATILGALATAFLLGPELDRLVVSILVIRICVLAVFVAVVADLLLGSRFLTQADFSATLRFGGWQAIFNGLSGIISAADRFVIGWVAGAAATALFTIPFSLTSRLKILTISVRTALFPKLSSVKGDNERRDLGERAAIAILAATAAVTIPAILFIKPFFAVWIDAEFAADAGPIAQILLVAALVQACLSTLFVTLVASGRPDLPAKLRMFSALPFLATLTLCVWLFGGVGAALALFIRFAIELLWTLSTIRLLSRLIVPVIGFLVACAVAMLVARLEYGLVGGALLSAISMMAMIALATHLSEDISRILAGALRKAVPIFKRGY